MRKLLVASAILATGLLGFAQPKSEAKPGSEFHDTSALKPPAGAKVAVYEFEDMECPKCAHDSALVHATCAKYNVPLVRKDFPWYFHAWAMDAAVNARFVQDHVSPAMAETYRKDVFAAQDRIASRDDLRSFTNRWYAAHKVVQPFSTDPTGKLAAEVKADLALGQRVGVHATPTLFVVTANGCVNVDDATQLAGVLQSTLQQTRGKQKN